MIYTITVNPTIDVTNRLTEGDRVEPKTHRPATQQRHAGGKGIDVSRVIRNLGGRSVAMGFLGGFTGQLVEGLLLEEALEVDFVRIEQETRTNVIIVEIIPGRSTESKDYRFNSPGPGVQPYEARELYKKIEDLDKLTPERRPTYAAVCGSLCQGMSSTFYINIIRYLKSMNATVALDSSGAALKEALRYDPRPHLIKPNIEEFYELMSADRIPRSGARACECGIARESKSLSASAFWRDLLKKVGEFRTKYEDVDALLTLGEAGMLLLHGNTLLHACLPKSNLPKVVNTVGAGDASLGGLLFELESGNDWECGLRTAIAAGSAAVELSGTQAPTREHVEKFLVDIDVHQHGMIALGEQTDPLLDLCHMAKPAPQARAGRRKPQRRTANNRRAPKRKGKKTKR